MTKIVLDAITSGYNPQRIKANFDKLAAIINDQLLSRDNATGDVNQMVTPLDMNQKAILNLPTAVNGNEAVTLAQVTELLTNIVSIGEVVFSDDGVQLVGSSFNTMQLLLGIGDGNGNIDGAVILAALLSVDGVGSELDSDTVDGVHAAQLVKQDSDTGAASIPVGTTEQRPVNPVEGMTRNNTTLSRVERFINGGWEEAEVPDVLLTDQRNTTLNQEVVTQGVTSQPGFSSDIFTGSGVDAAKVTVLDMSTGDNGGMVWQKSRSTAAGHTITDTLRGTGNTLASDSSAVEVSGDAEGVSSFNSNGFNSAAPLATMVSWSWLTTHKTSGTTNTGRAYECHYNPKTGFSMALVEAGTSAGSQLVPSHLNQKTELASTKTLDATGSHYISHESFGTGGNLTLDTQNMINLSPDNDIIHVDDGVVLSGTVFNPSGRFLVIQKHSVAGYSDIGIYNPSGELGYEVETGFETGYVNVKRVNLSGNWNTLDAMRGGSQLHSDLPNAEFASNYLTFSSSGFTLTTVATNINALGSSYLYESYAASSTNGTHSQADYDEPTSPDTVSLREDSIVSFASGFDANGTVNNALTIGENVTFTIPNGTPEGKSYLYIGATGIAGLTQLPYAEGIARIDGDPVGDFYNIVTGIMVDENDAPIQRVYLATIDIDTEGHAANIENYGVSRAALNDVDVHGFLRTHGNRKILDFGVVSNNNRYIIPLPDGWDWEDCATEVQILVDGKWSTVGNYTSAGTIFTMGVGSLAEGVVVQTGTTGLATVSSNDGSTGGFVGNVTSAPCRVILTNNGRTTNA